MHPPRTVQVDALRSAVHARRKLNTAEMRLLNGTMPINIYIYYSYGHQTLIELEQAINVYSKYDLPHENNYFIVVYRLGVKIHTHRSGELCNHFASLSPRETRSTNHQYVYAYIVAQLHGIRK